MRAPLAAPPSAIYTAQVGAVGLVEAESENIAISLPVAYMASKLVESFLYGLKRNDPAALTFAALLLFAIAVLAGFVPARRASRIDPATALRHE